MPSFSKSSWQNIKLFLFTKQHFIWRVFLIVFFAYLAILVFGFTLNNWSALQIDDVFITLRYAKNIQTGQGFFYNFPREGFLATTAPLWAILLGTIGKIFKDLPALALVLCGIFLWLQAWLLYAITRHYHQEVLGIIGAALLVTDNIILSTFGLETTFFLFLLLLTIYFFIKHEYWLTGVAGALLVLTRPEGVFLLVVIGLIYIWLTRRWPFKILIGACLVLVVWAFYSYLSLRVIIPSTIAVKMAQGRTNWWQGMIFSESLASRFFGPGAMGLTLLALLGAGCALLKKQLWLLIIIAWLALYLSAFTICSVPGYHWYYSPVYFALYILAAAAIFYFLGQLAREKHCENYLKTVVALVLLFVIAGHAFAKIPNMVKQNIAYGLDKRSVPHVYQRAGEWLAANTPPDAHVAAVEIGLIGYYAERPIIDLVGLATPRVAAKLAAGDDSWAIRELQPDYLALNSPIWEISGATPGILKKYRLVKSFTGDNKDINIYQRIN